MKEKKPKIIRKAHARNKIIIDEISYKLKNSKSLVIFEYHGLIVANLEELRKTFKPLGVELKIYKNTLFSRAIQESSYTNLDEFLNGANAFIFNYENELSGLKQLYGFAKKNSKLKIKCGVIDSTILNADLITTLSQLPNKEGMISMFMSCVQSPLRSFINVVNAIVEQKQHESQK